MFHTGHIMRKLVFFLSIKVCKLILVVTQNKIRYQKFAQYVSFSYSAF